MTSIENAGYLEVTHQNRKGEESGKLKNWRTFNSSGKLPLKDILYSSSNSKESTSEKKGGNLICTSKSLPVSGGIKSDGGGPWEDRNKGQYRDKSFTTPRQLREHPSRSEMPLAGFLHKTKEETTRGPVGNKGGRQ